MAIVRLVCWDVEEVSFDQLHIVSQVQESLRSFMNSNSFSVRCIWEQHKNRLFDYQTEYVGRWDSWRSQLSEPASDRRICCTRDQ